MDPHEYLQVAALFGWSLSGPLETVGKYKESLKKYPNPPAPNITKY
jgi:arylsulfatase